MLIPNRKPKSPRVAALSAELAALLNAPEAPARRIESPAERIARIHEEAMARS